ncbi:hypothetical protein [Ekhidna sp.]
METIDAFLGSLKDFFTLSIKQYQGIFLGILTTTSAGLLLNRLLQKSQKGIDKKFFKDWTDVGSRSTNVLHYYMYYINPIRKTFVRAPLVLREIKVRDDYFDIFYKAEYYSLDSKGKTKNYKGKGTVKGNILELTLLDTEKGEVLFIISYLSNNRESSLFNALHLGTDHRNDTICSNRLIRKISLNQETVKLKGEIIYEKDRKEDPDLEEIFNYLQYDAKRIKLTQFTDHDIEGLRQVNKKLMQRLQINKLQKMIGTWISFSTVYGDNNVYSFRWSITQNEKSFEVYRDSNEELYKGTVKYGHDFISFLLTQSGIIHNEFVDLVPTGKRKHLMAMDDEEEGVFKGLTSTFVRENSDSHPVVTREIMVKLSDSPITIDKAKRGGPETWDMVRDKFVNSDLCNQDAERLTQIVKEYIENGNDRIYAKLQNQHNVKRDQFSGTYYVYYINSATDEFERFFLSVDKKKGVECQQYVNSKGSGERIDTFVGGVPYENKRQVIIQAYSEKRPVAITILRATEKGGYLTTYNKGNSPVATRATLKKTDDKTPHLKDWNKSAYKELEEELRTKGPYLVYR